MESLEKSEWDNIYLAVERRGLPASPVGHRFEFSVNGRSTGPKVCLGRRYLSQEA